MIKKIFTTLVSIGFLTSLITPAFAQNLQYEKGGKTSQKVLNILKSSEPSINVSVNDIFATEFDLNQDGQKEIFYVIRKSSWCGSAGCRSEILEKQPNGKWKPIFNLIGGEVNLGSRSTNGYRELDLSSGAWKNFSSIFTFNGLDYELGYFQHDSYQVTPLGFNNGTVIQSSVKYSKPTSSATINDRVRAGQKLFVRGEIGNWYLCTFTREADQPFYLPMSVVRMNR